jgi:hypothetical protein
MKKWRANNQKRTELIQRKENTLSMMRSFGFPSDDPEFKRIEAKAIPPHITHKEARSFYTSEQANPSGLLLTLVYGKDYMKTLSQLAELGEARKNFRTLNPGTRMPSELNDALAVRK